MSIYFEIDIPSNLSQPGRRQQWNLFSNQSELVKLASAFEKSTYANFWHDICRFIKMKLLMPITSAPIGQNWHMSISHRRDKPFIMAVIARYRRSCIVLTCPVFPLHGAFCAITWRRTRPETVVPLNKLLWQFINRVELSLTYVFISSLKSW